MRRKKWTRFGSHHPLGGFQIFVPPVSGDQMPPVTHDTRAPSEKHGKTTMHGKKEEKAKTVEQEMKKEKSGKSSSVLKDKVPETKKGEKISKPEPQIKKEAKPEQHDSKPEPVVPHGKPEQKVLKQVKAITAEKTEKAEPQEKERQSIKTDKPKPSPMRISENKVQLPTEINIILFYLSSVLTIFFKEGTSEVADSGKKKVEKSEKENKVPTGQENLQVHNVTKEESKDTPTSKRDKEDSKDLPVSKKDKGPISFFQCVYLDGYNGYGFQFPVTPAQHPGGNSGKPNSPGQKQQGQ
ncbi:triadin [Cricetulus griseus]|nr:triadin [Cricetulus griseus]